VELGQAQLVTTVGAQRYEYKYKNYGAFLANGGGWRRSCHILAEGSGLVLGEEEVRIDCGSRV